MPHGEQTYAPQRRVFSFTRAHAYPRGTFRRAGFALFTVCAVLFLLSLAAAFVVPAIQSAGRASRARATIEELKSFESAFSAYAQKNGNWPLGSAKPGEYPSGMEAALRPTRWNQRSPIGGRYVWLTETTQRGTRVHATIAIVSYEDEPVSDDPRQLNALVDAAKTGGLNPDRLRFGFRNEPVYVLEF